LLRAIGNPPQPISIIPGCAGKLVAIDDVEIYDPLIIFTHHS
jgi:hypothetical protein